MKKYNFITLFLVSAAFMSAIYFGSCKKETIETVDTKVQQLVALPTLLSIYNDFSQPVDGMVGVQSSSPIFGQDNPEFAYEGFVKKEDATYTDVGASMKVGNVTLDRTEQNYYMKQVRYVNQKLTYGAENEVTFGDFKSSLYIPKLMKALNTADMDTYIKPGFEIKWEADPKNKLGVALTLEYDVLEPLRYKEGFKEVINTVYVPNDTGSYTFKESDFKGLADGTRLSIRLGRANYKIVEWNQKKINIYGFTYVIIPLRH